MWNLTEEDHTDLQAWRGSVYELVAFLRERGLVHALAHPLYRMGPPLTAGHVERMMLLFSVWEGRNGARPEDSNLVACRIAATAMNGYLAKLAGRHDLDAVHTGPIALTGGSDDHGAIDIASTWTEAPGDTPAAFLEAVAAGAGKPEGAHGSAVKLAHAMAALAANAYRESAEAVPPLLDIQLRALFDDDAEDAAERHTEIQESSRALVRLLGSRAREGGLGNLGFSSVGPSPRSLAVRRRRLELPTSSPPTTTAAPAPTSRRSRRPSSASARSRTSRARSSSPTPSPRRTASPGRCAASRRRVLAAG